MTLRRADRTDRVEDLALAVAELRRVDRVTPARIRRWVEAVLSGDLSALPDDVRDRVVDSADDEAESA
jgi:hypothetical protein